MERKKLMKITKKNLWQGNHFQNETYTKTKNTMQRSTNPTKTPSGNATKLKKNYKIMGIDCRSKPYSKQTSEIVGKPNSKKTSFGQQKIKNNKQTGQDISKPNLEIETSKLIRNVNFWNKINSHQCIYKYYRTQKTYNI